MLNAHIRDLAIVFLVSDLARTLRFYRETLGLEFQVADPEEGYLQARLPNQVDLVFFAGDAPRGASPQVVFGLARGGIDALVESLAAAGVEFVTPVTEAPGGWSADFKDPDDHLLSLYQDGTLPR